MSELAVSAGIGFYIITYDNNNKSKSMCCICAEYVFRSLADISKQCYQ